MSKILKMLVVGVSFVLLLTVAAMVAVLVLVDPNDYKDDITAAVHDATGRELTLRGDIQLSIFPWLGVSLGETQLSNAAGFGEAPFAQVDVVDIKVKLLPLLEQRVEMKTVRLQGLQVVLAKNKAGHTNWDDLAGVSIPEAAPKDAANNTTSKTPDKTSTKTSTKASTTPALAALAIGGVEIIKAKITWDDQQTSQHVVLDQLTLTTGPLTLSDPIDINLATNVVVHEPAIQAPVKLSGKVKFDIEANHYWLEGLSLVINAQGKGLPISPLDVRLIVDVDANLGQQQVNIRGLQLDALGATLRGDVSLTDVETAPIAQGKVNAVIKNPASLLSAAAVTLPPGFKADGLNNSQLALSFNVSQGKQVADISSLVLDVAGMKMTGQVKASAFLEAPEVVGQIQLAPFSPHQLLATLGITLPEMADANVLQQAGLDLAFTGSMNDVAVKKLSFRLDDTELTGTASVKHFEKPAVRYALSVNGIDIDRYLPPKVVGEPSPPPAPAAAVGATQLPLDLLRGLDIDGLLTMKQLKAANVKLSDLEIGLKAKGGLLRLNPVKAKLYQGHYAGNIGLDVKTDTPKLSLNEKLTQVKVGPLLKDLLGDEPVSGTANVSAKLNVKGIEPDAMMKTLNGNAQFSFKDGAVKGVNIGQMIREAYAKIKKKPAPPKTTNETDFAEMSGSVKITKGVVHNADLKAKSPLLRINGKGVVDLPQKKQDYLANVAIVETDKGQAGTELAELKSLTIPLRIKGTFDKPKFSLELGPVLKAKAKAELKRQKKKLKKKVEKKVEKKKAELKKKLDTKKEESKQKLKDKLKEKLKGLF